MFCHKCGVKVMDGAHFCQKCGAKLLQDESVSASDESIAKTSVTSEIPKNSEREKIYTILIFPRHTIMNLM